MAKLFWHVSLFGPSGVTFRELIPMVDYSIKRLSWITQGPVVTSCNHLSSCCTGIFYHLLKCRQGQSNDQFSGNFHSFGISLSSTKRQDHIFLGHPTPVPSLWRMHPVVHWWNNTSMSLSLHCTANWQWVDLHQAAFFINHWTGWPSQVMFVITATWDARPP